MGLCCFDGYSYDCSMGVAYVVFLFSGCYFSNGVVDWG